MSIIMTKEVKKISTIQNLYFNFLNKKIGYSYLNILPTFLGVRQPRYTYYMQRNTLIFHSKFSSDYFIIEIESEKY